MSVEALTAALMAMEGADSTLRITRVLTPDASSLPESIQLRFSHPAIALGDALAAETSGGDLLPVE